MDQANKITVADCDLFLACDILVGAQQHLLTVTDAERTIAVTSTAQVPTGQMVVDTQLAFPDVDGLVARIDASTRSDLNVALAAPGLLSPPRYADRRPGVPFECWAARPRSG